MDDHVHAAHDVTMQDCAQPDAMTVVQLKDELRRRRLRTSGNKAELIERLKAAICLEGQNEGSDDEHDDKEDGNSRRLDALPEGTDDEEDDGDDDRHHRRARCLLSFRDVEDSIDTFSGDDGKNINQWINDFRETAKLCAWTNVQKTIYAKKLLRGSARLFVQYEVREKTWRNIKAALKTEFSPKIDSYAIHKELQQRTKRKDETYHEYCYRMLEIASKVNMEISAVIQYIIDGVADDEVNKMILYGAASIAELKRKFDIYETMRNRMRPISKREGQNKSVRADRDNNNVSKQNIKRCFNCGSKQHLSNECPDKDKGSKCFNCSEFGHVAIRCPKKGDKATSGSVKPRVRCDALKSGDRKIYKDVEILGKQVAALIDSGSDLHLVRSSLYVQLGTPRLNPKTVTFDGVGAPSRRTLGRFTADVSIDGETYKFAFDVVPDGYIGHDLLIGSELSDYAEVTLKNRSAKIRRLDPKEVTVMTNDAGWREVLNINVLDEPEDEFDVSVAHIVDKDVKTEVQQLIESYEPVCSKASGVKMRLMLKDEVPVHQNPRRLSAEQRGIVNSIIDQCIKDSIVRPSASEYASPIVLVEKKNGEPRLCVDYRGLNKKLLRDRRTFNRHRKKARQYKEGDLVAVERTQFGPGLKLFPKFLGPYKIITVMRNNRYRVEKVGIHEGPNYTSSSADRMKPWTNEKDFDHGWRDDDSEPEIDDYPKDDQNPDGIEGDTNEQDGRV